LIIERVETQVADIALAAPALNAAGVRIERIGCVLVRLKAGATGESLVYAMRSAHIGALRSMIDSMGELIVGEDTAYPERIWTRLWREVYFYGFTGVSMFAISALDTAVWDAHAKSLDVPLARLLGQCRDAVPAYASHLLWTDRGPDEIGREAAGLVEAGFRAMKMRFGGRTIDDEIARVRAVREAVGEDIVLMADASRSLPLDYALRLGRRLEEFNLAWFEEPLPAHDIASTATIAAALDTRIASGENEYTLYGFRRLLETKAADVWMMDLARVGGISEMRKVAALAAAYDIPVSNHVYTEHSLAALASFSNCEYIEYMDWFEPLIEQQLELVDGALVVPDRPGIGYTFDWKAIEKVRVG
jgi:L-alanine-DL-glutamate epimerase-like enolase superfamily enzyme